MTAVEKREGAVLRESADGISLVNVALAGPEGNAEGLIARPGPLPDLGAIEAEVRAFEAEERARLGLAEEPEQAWFDPNPQRFVRAERDHVTILAGGLTLAHDRLIVAALSQLGYRLEALGCPDQEALRFGKEFGNRGQCNPTYFTVGNLLKRLVELRDRNGLSADQISERYVFLTAGACGPCRFGTYATEYRKVLRDAGFPRFRVLLFQQQGGLRQATGEGSGLELDRSFFWQLLRSIVAGDVLNAVGYRIRPYEVEPGATDRAVEAGLSYLETALRDGTSIKKTLRRARDGFRAIEVCRLQPKPKVAVIGEFWAMTTEGAGNYHLQRFLELEGAEVDVQPVTAWLLYNLWQNRRDVRLRMSLPGEDGGRMGLRGVSVRKKLAMIWVAERGLRLLFRAYAKAVGLPRFPLPDMDHLAALAHPYYWNDLRGGEGHMEVGKLIHMTEDREAHMVVSVKPFGCMPSSSVSDGVQTKVLRDYPAALFCPIETTGDGEVNAHSRVQMVLFKARKRAQAELVEALEARGLSADQARAALGAKRRRATYAPRHKTAGTAANLVWEL